MESKLQQQAPQKAQANKPNLTGIPTQMKLDFEQRSGLSFDDVRVHYNSDKPAQLQALAYTQGTQVYVGPGQAQHLSHELIHVAQQKLGLVMRSSLIRGYPINTDRNLEKDAKQIIFPKKHGTYLGVNVIQCSFVLQLDGSYYASHATPPAPSYGWHYFGLDKDGNEVFRAKDSFGNIFEQKISPTDPMYIYSYYEMSKDSTIKPFLKRNENIIHEETVGILTKQTAPKATKRKTAKAKATSKSVSATKPKSPSKKWDKKVRVPAKRTSRTHFGAGLHEGLATELTQKIFDLKSQKKRAIFAGIQSGLRTSTICTLFYIKTKNSISRKVLAAHSNLLYLYDHLKKAPVEKKHMLIGGQKAAHTLSNEFFEQQFELKESKIDSEITPIRSAVFLLNTLAPGDAILMDANPDFKKSIPNSTSFGPLHDATNTSRFASDLHERREKAKNRARTLIRSTKKGTQIRELSPERRPLVSKAISTPDIEYDTDLQIHYSKSRLCPIRPQPFPPRFPHTTSGPTGDAFTSAQISAFIVAPLRDEFPMDSP